jgi:hypothetical protein
MRNLLRSFRKDETGSVTVEFVIVIPLLIWCFAGIHVFFQAYRTQTINVKAAYTLGDQVSRETNYITPVYMDSLENLHEFLTATNEPTSIRVTAFEYERDDDTYRVIWSQGRDGQLARITDARILDVRGYLPIMPDEEIAIMTETWVNFESADFVGLPPFTSYEVVVTRPRFASQVCWNPIDNGDQTTAVCQAGY